MAEPTAQPASSVPSPAPSAPPAAAAGGQGENDNRAVLILETSSGRVSVPVRYSNPDLAYFNK